MDARRLRHNPGRTDSGRGRTTGGFRPEGTPLPEPGAAQADRGAAGTDEARTLILLAGLTGLRWGELSALTVGDVDVPRGRVKVTRACTRLAAGRVRREVPIGAMVRSALTQHVAGKGRSDLLFATREGRPLWRESFARNSFELAVAAAGHAVSALQALLGMDPQRRVGCSTPLQHPRSGTSGLAMGCPSRGSATPPHGQSSHEQTRTCGAT